MVHAVCIVVFCTYVTVTECVLSNAGLWLVQKKENEKVVVFAYDEHRKGKRYEMGRRFRTDLFYGIMRDRRATTIWQGSC